MTENMFSEVETIFFAAVTISQPLRRYASSFWEKIFPMPENIFSLIEKIQASRIFSTTETMFFGVKNIVMVKEPMYCFTNTIFCGRDHLLNNEDNCR